MPGWRSIAPTLGRLLAALGDQRDRTFVVVLGDNGSSDEGEIGEFAGKPAMGTVYEGGIRVPLIAAGPLIAEPGTPVTALVTATDVFATLAEAAGIDPTRLVIDGVSFLPPTTSSGSSTNETPCRESVCP